MGGLLVRVAARVGGIYSKVAVGVISIGVAVSLAGGVPDGLGVIVTVMLAVSVIVVISVNL
jgi:hypothetical protein